MHDIVQAVRPHAIVDLIRAGETIRVPQSEAGAPLPKAGKCEQCGYMSSNAVCKACVLLEGLNKGLPASDITGRHSHKKRPPEIVQIQASSQA